MQKFELLIKWKWWATFLFIMLISSSGCMSEEINSANHEKLIQKYIKSLKQDPENCFYAEQIAGSYQALNNFKDAIIFYRKALKFCPDSSLNTFQLGVCHYLLMERDLGEYYMDQAIKMAKKNNDVKTADLFNKEKKAWLEKWDIVKEMDWNKDQKEK